LLNSQLGILVVFLAPVLGLANSDIGLIVLIYTSVGALTQPIFGWLADRYSARWISGASLLWIVLWMSTAVSTKIEWAIPLLVVGSLGSAGFHAAGTERATERGSVIMLGRAATAASLFFLFGLTGHAFGPAIGGFIIERTGRRGVLVLTILALPVAFNSIYRLYWSADDQRQESNGTNETKSEKVSEFYKNRWIIGVFVVMILLRTAPGMTSMTFLPKLFQDRGYAPGAYGIITSVFMGATAIGGLAGGLLADRWGRLRLIFWSLLLAVLPMYYYPVISEPIIYPIVFLAGSLNGASFSVVVVLAQSLLPSRRAFASGLTLGAMFASGSLGSYLFGLAADVYPLSRVMQTNGVLCLLAALLSLYLQRHQSSNKVYNDK
ncbi:MAG: MFS transporter, partial [Chloroflexota bacterium]|nr:MFS transporter [Chloroflexota bacterium]